MREYDIKKIIIYGAGALIVLGALGGLFYYFLLRKTAAPQTPTRFGTLPQIPGAGTGGGGGGGTAAQPTGAGEQQVSATTTRTGALALAIGTSTPDALMQIITKPIVGPTLSPKGDTIFYFVRQGGKAESADFNGEQTTQISNLTILNILDALWQPAAKKKTAISYLDNETKKTFVMAAATATQTAFLPATTVDAAWSPDGNAIAYLTRDNNSASLFISGSSGKSGKFVFSPPIPDVSIQWIAKNKILFVTKPSIFAPGVAYLFDVGTQSFSKIIGPAFGLTAVPSPDGKLLIYAKADAAGGALNFFISNADGSNGRPIPFATLPEKCAFSQKNTNLLCAVPKNISIFQAVPDDWYMGKGFFSDAVVMLNTKTLATTVITPTLPIDVISPFLSPQEDFLFFQNKKDYSLWRLKLK